MYASAHRKITVYPELVPEGTTVIRLHLTKPYGSMDVAAAKTDQVEEFKRTELTEAGFLALLDDLYRTGGSPDILYASDDAYEACIYRCRKDGTIGFWEFSWLMLRLRVKQALRGLSKMRGNSGAPSARPTPGTEKTESR